MTPVNLFNYNSVRAKKSRWSKVLATDNMHLLLVVVGLAFVAGGAALLMILGMPVGWLVASLAFAPWMLAAFGHSLRDMPPAADGQTIDDLLDFDLLGKLPENPTPQQICKIALQVGGGRFMATRFGIAPFVDLAGGSIENADQIWQSVIDVRAKLQAKHISAAAVVVAIMQAQPESDHFLAAAKLSIDDLLSGARWYEQLLDRIKASKQKHSGGGLGRDWSFGYTPLLDRFAVNISAHLKLSGRMTSDIPSRQVTITQVMHNLYQGTRRNAALVGGLGSGKTTLVHDLAKKLMSGDKDVPEDLRYRQIFALDPSTLISRASGRGELEALIQHLMGEAFEAKSVILFLDDAQLFFEDGTGSVDLSNVLLPILEGGGLKLILAMDEQRWLRISQMNPALAQNLNRVAITPANETETMLAMQDQVPLLEYQNKVTYSYQSLAAAYRLSNRFLADQVMPGKALKLLESAAGFSEQGYVSEHSVEQAIEKTQGIKVGTVNTGQERQTLLNLEQLIHQRMVNQTRAVQVVSDALRRARAGVRNPNRPIGTFLFLGPTGVGKSELAKSVAAVFFGGENQLVRLDLNEYSSPGDVQRLIADAAQDQHSLTAQIARNPFSVVLLDEVEKAHPNVLNTLLQMLDEGILRDINNREVSFRDAVIIATSNAGADRIRQHIEAGEKLEQFEQQFIDELINTNIFRPEFLNRFDETVLFRPLTREELLQVVDLILNSVNKNLAAQKVSIIVDPDAKQMLVEAGYDPRLGARPMRRVVQRVVENIAANQMLSGVASAGSQIHVTAKDVQVMLARN
jgi:ATP-dependent Clp protease ATP-binding subunit ClpC